MGDRMRYEVRVAERMSETAALAFPELHARHEHAGTVLTGPVQDQAELHGLLSRIQTLGFTLVSVERVGE